jgi:hypothetical protein
MVDHDDEIDDGASDGIDDADDERVSVDPVAAATALANLVTEFSKAYKLVTTDKAKAAALRAVARLDRQAADAVAMRDEAQAQAAAIVAKVESDTKVLAEREHALEVARGDFETSLQEARDHLRAYHDNIAEADRIIRHRILSHTGLLSGYVPELQDLPTWPQIRRLVVGLPDDPTSLEREVVSHPRIDAFSDVCSDPGADRHGAPFLGELTRDVSHKRKSAA